MIGIELYEFNAYNNSAGRNTLYTRVSELTFKRHVMSSDTRPLLKWFFFRMAVQYEYLYLFR